MFLRSSGSYTPLHSLFFFFFVRGGIAQNAKIRFLAKFVIIWWSYLIFHFFLSFLFFSNPRRRSSEARNDGGVWFCFSFPPSLYLFTPRILQGHPYRCFMVCGFIVYTMQPSVWWINHAAALSLNVLLTSSSVRLFICGLIFDPLLGRMKRCVWLFLTLCMM